MFFCIIAACCESVAITASKENVKIKPKYLGKFSYYRNDSNGRRMYRNWSKQYLYYQDTSSTHWAVRKKYLCISCQDLKIMNLDLFNKSMEVYSIF